MGIKTTPLSRLVPSRVDLLQAWMGPVRVSGPGSGTASAFVYDLYPLPNGEYRVWWSRLDGVRTPGSLSQVFLSLDRDEVRDRFVRCGAPAWAKDHPAALLAWALGIFPQDVLQPWETAMPATSVEDNPEGGATWIRRPMFDPKNRGGSLWVGSRTEPWRPFGWECSLVRSLSEPWTWTRGTETGPEGCLFADIEALNAGFVLAEPTGWYIPLPDNKVGWLPKEGT